MCFSIRLVVCSCALGAFVFSGIAIAAEKTAVVKETAEQCAKGGKTLSTVKTKDECVKQGGAWEKMGIPTLPADSLDKKRQTKLPDDPLTKKNKTLRPPDPLEKNKAMPDDPFGKKNKTTMPDDPFNKGNAMPPAGHIAPSGGK